MTERTSVLTVKARRSGAPALEARAVLRPAVRRLGAVALGFAGGWAVLYGALMPFGLGLVLGLAEDCFAPCAAGAALGVLLHGFGALSLRSVCLLCALGAAVAVRWVWPGRFLPAVLAGCGTLAAMGLCFALGTGGGAELALFCTADALLAGLLGLALRRFPPEKPGFGTLLTGAAVAAALGNLPLERFFPGVAVCAAVELVLCSRGQPGAALACSGMLGAALCAADPALACGAAGLACGASAACILAPGRRVEAVAAYAGGCVTGVLCVQPPGQAFAVLFSAGAGILCVLALPKSWLAPVAAPADRSQPVERARYPAAATRLEAVAQSLSSLAETVNDVYNALPHRCESYRWVIDNTHDSLCFNCGRREQCWKQEYAATLEGMEALRPLLEENGRLEPAQLPGQLSRCIHPAALCAAAARSFALYRSRKESRLHAEAMRTVFGMAGAAAQGEVSGDAVQQFCSPTAAQMILCDGMGTGRPAAVDGNLAAELTARLLKAGIPAELAARLVNVALALKSEEESGATLDLISVDLYTGTARLFKAGAAPGFLVHGGRARAVGDVSLPVGILGGVNGQSRVVHLCAGDYAVLVSDGLLVDGTAWVAKQLELSAAAGEAPAQVAKTLVETARARALRTGRPDDITAAVLRLENGG